MSQVINELIEQWLRAADKLPSVLPEALKAVREIQNKCFRAYALSALADKLPPELLPEPLKAVREIQSEWNRSSSLRTLADKLPSLLPEALTCAKLTHSAPLVQTGWRDSQSLDLHRAIAQNLHSWLKQFQSRAPLSNEQTARRTCRLHPMPRGSKRFDLA